MKTPVLWRRSVILSSKVVGFSAWGAEYAIALENAVGNQRMGVGLERDHIAEGLYEQDECRSGVLLQGPETLRQQLTDQATELT